MMDQAVERGLFAVVNGGDVLPKGQPAHAIQGRFIAEYLPAYLAALGEAGIEYWAMLGNDDLQALAPAWRDVLAAAPNAHDLTDGWRAFGDGLTIRGLNHVPDHPFGLKDLSVLDDDEFRSPPQYGPPVVSTPSGFEGIDDLHEFLRARPTMEALLDGLAGGAEEMDRAVAVVHCPPSGAGLATIGGDTDVGSAALRRWIEARQPMLTLHGHIHESPKVSGADTARIGRTVAHQPGQSPAPGPFAEMDGRAIMSVVTVDGGAVGIERLCVEL